MITKDGSLAILDLILNSTGVNARLRVANNNPAIADADMVLGDLTEATFPGYAEVALTGQFPASALNGANEAESDSPTFTFTEAGGPAVETCYLAYIVIADIAATDRLYAVALFPTPQTVSVDGDKVTFTLHTFAWNGTP